MSNLSPEEIGQLALRFAPEGMLKAPVPFGGGHINDTYLFSPAGEKGRTIRASRKPTFSARTPNGRFARRLGARVLCALKRMKHSRGNRRRRRANGCNLLRRKEDKIWKI